VKSEEIKDLLEPVIEDYAKSREEGERFGDFVIRKGYVKATSNGLDFHSDVVLPEPAAKK
jgi:sulfite reductase (NADPH) hemoprotein beta-component